MRRDNSLLWRLAALTLLLIGLAGAGAPAPVSAAEPTTTIAAPAAAPVPAPAAQGERCFQETGFCISGRIREFWEQTGGLPVFGYPIGPAQNEVNQEDGKEYLTQWFERNRLEHHPENSRPYDVLLGRLGVDVLKAQGRDWMTFPVNSRPDDGPCFVETGHCVAVEFFEAFNKNGLEFIPPANTKLAEENLALYGMPVSSLMTETIDGKQYTVQWFERARFELHPELPEPYRVSFGLLGNTLKGRK